MNNLKQLQTVGYARGLVGQVGKFSLLYNEIDTILCTRTSSTPAVALKSSITIDQQKLP